MSATNSTAAEVPIPGVKIPSIVLPAEKYCNRHWPVVACDQFTSEPTYWFDRTQETGQQASSLELILPEYYLSQESETELSERVETIWRRMEEYRQNNIFQQYPPGLILTSRTLPDMKTIRHGVIIALDLEYYSFTHPELAQIRASECTVEDRLPARVNVRKGCSLELSHVLFLIDDPQKNAVENLIRRAEEEKLDPLYDLDLPASAGRLRGDFFPESSPAVRQFLSQLAQLPSMREEALLGYVGDGNHSLAAAKLLWEAEKEANPALRDGPARYALVELINIHDDGLIFHPIHQLFFSCELKRVTELAALCFAAEDLHIRELSEEDLPLSEQDLSRGRFADWQASDQSKENTDNGLRLILRQGKQARLLTIAAPQDRLAVSAAHRLADLLQKKDAVRCDYIHGEKALKALSEEENVALYLPQPDKTNFFSNMKQLGILPKKAFSLGNALEKRHYMEARFIK